VSDEAPRRPGHLLKDLSVGGGYVDCGCGQRLTLIAEDHERLARTGDPVSDALLDAHRAHLAGLGGSAP
jgi:hypothetical protein